MSNFGDTLRGPQRDDVKIEIWKTPSGAWVSKTFVKHEDQFPQGEAKRLLDALLVELNRK